ncbi:hypothetical protein HBE96_23405 [Clostridium sp. P21]|uniref:Uncharacterized protein n=1 Tax=Clostridium muellerianum TaxID=2716538 RepID=A0A7Y0EL71_9CLOT|nr:hypothetical protein [Clostridium muellerianum]NMM65528.1 hypothetical protein [Clostridium muellerianum]
MMLCLTCGLQRPNSYKNNTCPRCKSHLKYIEAAAKGTAVKLHKAGLSVSYATAEVYSYNSYAVHTVNISIGLAKPYQVEVLRRLPEGYEYVFPEAHIIEYLSHIPIEHLLSPLLTYCVLRYEAQYLDNAEAKAVLKQKLIELDDWVDEAVEDGWLAICNLGGLL